MSQTKPVHYTIYPGNEGGEVEGRPAVVVLSHDLGSGWRRHIVELQRGDTADNPSSTKGPIYGPNFIVYDVAPSGITTTLYDNAGQFYDALYEARAPRAS